MPRSGDLASRTALVSMTRSPTPAPWRRPLMTSLDVRPTRRLGDSMRSRLSFAARFDVAARLPRSALEESHEELDAVAARLLLDPPSSSSLNARTVIVPARTCGGGGNRVGRTVRSVRARRTGPGSFRSAVNGRGDPDRGVGARGAPPSSPRFQIRPTPGGQIAPGVTNGRARVNAAGRWKMPAKTCVAPLTIRVPVPSTRPAARYASMRAARRGATAKQSAGGRRNWGTAGLFCWNTHLGGAIDRAGSGCRRGAQGGREVDAHAGKGHSSEKIGVFCPEDLTLRPARIEK